MRDGGELEGADVADEVERRDQPEYGETAQVLPARPQRLAGQRASAMMATPAVPNRPKVISNALSGAANRISTGLVEKQMTAATARARPRRVPALSAYVKANALLRIREWEVRQDHANGDHQAEDGKDDDVPVQSSASSLLAGHSYSYQINNIAPCIRPAKGQGQPDYSGGRKGCQSGWRRRGRHSSFVNRHSSPAGVIRHPSFVNRHL